MLLVSSLGLAAGVAEVALRLTTPPAGTPTCCRFQHLYTWLEHDERLGWRNKPHLRFAAKAPAAAVPYEIRTNAHGMRDGRERERAPGPGTFRIAVVGDSLTFGANVQGDECYPRVLERTLGPGFEVLNFGVLGWGVDQMHRALEEVLGWAPDLVVFGVIADDLLRPIRAAGSAAPGRALFVLREDGQPILVEPADPALEAWRKSAGIVLRDPPASGSYLLWAITNEVRRLRNGRARADRALDTRWVLCRAILLDARRLVEAKGARFAVALLPQPPPDGLEFRPVVGRIAQDGVPFVDTYVPFDERAASDPGARLYLDNDPHPSPLGHRLLAERIAAFLRETGLLAKRPVEPGGR